MTTDTPTRTTNTKTTRVAATAGLLAGAIGIVVAKAGGMDMPLVPPGAVLLVVVALLVAILRTHRWPAYLVILVGLAEVIPGAISFGNADGAVQVTGTVIRVAGVLTALIAGLALAASNRKAKR